MPSSPTSSSSSPSPEGAAHAPRPDPRPRPRDPGLRPGGPAAVVERRRRPSRRSSTSSPRVTTRGRPATSSPPADRIATFDNDGTLWGEQPIYVQVVFALDRVHELAPQASRVEGTGAVQVGARSDDMAALGAAGEKGLVELVAATHAGMTTDEFEAIVDGLARHGEASAASTGPTPSSSTSRCSRCWPTCGPTASRPTSSPAAASSSCARGPRRSTASRRSRSSAVQHQVEVRDADGKPRARCAAPEIDFIDDKAGQAGRHPPLHRPPADDRLRQLRRRPTRCCE